MLSELRMQVQTALYAVPAKRKPALRRSDLPQALLATDLPLIAEDNAVAAFSDALRRQGWRIGTHQGWLTLDRDVPVPAVQRPERLTGAWGCVISLLLRHPDEAPAEDVIRAVVKAEDTGKMPFERLCGQLHADFAARLRRHEPLPGKALPYLCHAAEQLYSREAEG
ncbi:MAG: hypothetical protein IJB81_04605 [Clostridia bacterium]|nr:hypothetical protein [Clostridia bacterium]